MRYISIDLCVIVSTICILPFVNDIAEIDGRTHTQFISRISINVIRKYALEDALINIKAAYLAISERHAALIYLTRSLLLALYYTYRLRSIWDREISFERNTVAHQLSLSSIILSSRM